MTWQSTTQGFLLHRMATRRTPVVLEKVSGNKIPKIVENVEGSFHKYPSWRFSKADTDHEKWSVLDYHEDVIDDDNDPNGTSIKHTFSKSIDKELLIALKDRESAVWSEIVTQTGGRNSGTNSHYIPIYKLEKEAQKRAGELNIESDELFSLRLTGTKRVFGILEEGVFTIIWFDRMHEICPSPKR
mgnify:CR=1 FL=1